MDNKKDTTIGLVYVKNNHGDVVLSPQLLYKFYNDCNILCLPDCSGQMLSITTMEDINQLLTSLQYINQLLTSLEDINKLLTYLDYSALNVDIKTADSLASYNN